MYVTIIFMDILIYFVVLIICNICLLFALLLVCLHVNHQVTNASLDICLILYLYAPAYVLEC